MSNGKIDKAYWDGLYENKETSWDIGYASPALTDYIDQLSNKAISILIPGCGNGYEAQYLLQKGFLDVTLIDIVPQLTTALENKFEQYVGKQLKIITGDFFNLSGAFDLILEQTFLSALEPGLRKNYRDKMYQLLRPGGKLVGVLFGRTFEGYGPPFGGTREDYEELFSSKFDVKVMETCYNSIERRSGSEIFINLQRPA